MNSHLVQIRICLYFLLNSYLSMFLPVEAKSQFYNIVLPDEDHWRSQTNTWRIIQWIVIGERGTNRQCLGWSSKFLSLLTFINQYWLVLATSFFSYHFLQTNTISLVVSYILFTTTVWITIWTTMNNYINIY